MIRKNAEKITVLMLLILTAVTIIAFFSVRLYGVQFEKEIFTESTAALSNPDRGFYSVQAFTIKPEKQTFCIDSCRLSQDELIQIQINLRHFRYGEITEIGMQNIRSLFQLLAEQNARYIVRFLYDWNGKANETEPDNLEIILHHMKQLSPILKEYQKHIFLVQGLFTGNWGEMNGTHFGDQSSMKNLASVLLDSVGENTFLSVRTPAHWRQITGIIDPQESYRNASNRIGLFNDGMMGNYGDCGTYVGNETSKKDSPLSSWTREDELAFQDELCKTVPNGGEVILSNSLNDFENAVSTLRTMHISYLNSEYDTQVLNKWADFTVHDCTCYDGMDGLTYIERHLGYRYLLSNVELSYDYLRNNMTLKVLIKNVGFAPVYYELPISIVLVSESETVYLTPDGDLRNATGGNQSNDLLPIVADIPFEHLESTEYSVYLQIWNPIAEDQLALANEQEIGEHGYYLGRIQYMRPAWVKHETDFVI